MKFAGHRYDWVKEIAPTYPGVDWNMRVDEFHDGYALRGFAHGAFMVSVIAGRLSIDETAFVHKLANEMSLIADWLMTKDPKFKRLAWHRNKRNEKRRGS